VQEHPSALTSSIALWQGSQLGADLLAEILLQFGLAAVNAIIRQRMLCRSAEIRVRPELDVSIKTAHLDALDPAMDRGPRGRLSSKTAKRSSSRRQEKRRREIDISAFGLGPPPLYRGERDLRTR
jgi:hypothetical protein